MIVDELILTVNGFNEIKSSQFLFLFFSDCYRWFIILKIDIRFGLCVFDENFKIMILKSWKSDVKWRHGRLSSFSCCWCRRGGTVVIMKVMYELQSNLFALYHMTAWWWWWTMREKKERKKNLPISLNCYTIAPLRIFVCFFKRPK